jgi:hypothetical protein
MLLGQGRNEGKRMTCNDALPVAAIRACACERKSSCIERFMGTNRDLQTDDAQRIGACVTAKKEASTRLSDA